MQKEFIPYEQALELKELGFNEECLGYHNIDPYLPNPTFNLVKPFEHEWCLPAPLYQQAFRWFREKYKWNHSILTKRFPNIEYGYLLCVMEGEASVWNISGFNTYEEAELACLKKLIEIAKNK